MSQLNKHIPRSRDHFLVWDRSLDFTQLQKADLNKAGVVRLKECYWFFQLWVTLGKENFTEEKKMGLIVLTLKD